MKSDGIKLIGATILIVAILKSLSGCSTEPDPRDEIRPKRFESCDYVIVDAYTKEERCISRARLCRELVRCED